MKKNLLACALCAVCAAAMLAGCGEEETEEESVASAPVAEATATPTSTPSPTPLPYEQAWTYEIRENGYYNSQATWDAEGNFVSAPDYSAGSIIYYNDCDEYYNNFVSAGNIINEAMLVLDDIEYHSGENSMMVTNRTRTSKGFSGFALTMDAANAIDITQLKGKTIMLGCWVYYIDEFGLGVTEEQTFAFWSNLNTAADLAAESATVDPETVENYAEVYTEDEISLMQRCVAEEEYAHSQGFAKLSQSNAKRGQWNFIYTMFTVADDAESGCVALTTLGEPANTTVSVYNPFYIDDIVMIVQE